MDRLALGRARSLALGVAGLSALLAVLGWCGFALAFPNDLSMSCGKNCRVEVGIGGGLLLAGAVLMTALAAVGLVVAWLAYVVDAVVPRSRRDSPSSH